MKLKVYFFIGLILLFIISGCVKEQPEVEKKQIVEQNEDVRPVLKNLGVNIEPWNKKTNLAGDVIFDKRILFEDQNVKSEWVFVEFGANGQAKNNPDGKNIEFWFFVPLKTNVKAPIDGRITISYIEHTKDWAVHLHQEKSDYIVSFEHVTNLKVKEGDIVKVGDVLGDAAPRVNDKLGMVEFAIWKGGNGIIKFCPFDFLDDSLKPLYEEKLNKLTSDWEEFIGKDVYKQENWVSPGCLFHNITEVPSSN